MTVEDKHLCVFLDNLTMQFREELSNLYMALRKLAPPERRARSNLLDRWASMADRSRLTMARMVRNLESLGEVARNQSIFREDYDLVGLVSEICEGLTDLLAYRGLTLTFSCAEERHLCSINPEHIRQALYHLLSNAIKYTPPGGHIHVILRFSRSPRKVVLSVEDDGCGIAKEELSTLFTRYEVDGKESLTPRGVGLGLSICQWIAERHGGALTVNSEPGKGSAFTIMFPDKASKSLVFRQPTLYLDRNGGTNPALIALSDALPSDAFRITNQK